MRLKTTGLHQLTTLCLRSAVPGKRPDPVRSPAAAAWPRPGCGLSGPWHWLLVLVLGALTAAADSLPVSPAQVPEALPAPVLLTDPGGVYNQTIYDLDLLLRHYVRPPDNPAAPGDVFTPPWTATAPAAGAPRIAEYTRQAAPDRSRGARGGGLHRVRRERTCAGTPGCGSTPRAAPTTGASAAPRCCGRRSAR